MTHAVSSPCSDCPRAGRCFGGLMNDALIEHGAPAARVTRSVFAQRDYIHRQSDACEALYVVRGGATKTFVTSHEGEEEISGFQLGGDVAGLEAIGATTHRSNLRAITRTWTCRLALSDVRTALALSETFRNDLLGRMSQEFSRLHGMLHRERCTAEQRVASFLVAQLEREPGEAQAECAVHLPMTRADLARYLDLATETVSRVFTRLQLREVLRSEAGRCVIVDPVALGRLATA